MRARAHVKPREQRGVEIGAPVGGGDEGGVWLGLHPIEAAEEHREHAARGLVDLARARSGEGVELVHEEHAPGDMHACMHATYTCVR